MIVTHLAKFYPPVKGGMELVVRSLCRSTADRVENRVIAFHTSRTTRRETVEGIPVTRLGTIGRAGSVPVAAGLFGELQRLRSDLLVLHEPNPWALLACALVRPRIPLVVWYHSDVVRPRLQYALFYAPMANPVYARAARFVVSSPPLAECAAALAPYRRRTDVVPFGIELEALSPEPVKGRIQELRRRFEGRVVILAVGRMVPYKGFDVLLRSLEAVSADLVLVGDGPRRAEWMALAQRLGLHDRVHFAGEVPPGELLALYHACDIFVLPSITRAEAFGLVQVEAMACGKPVVSTRLPSGVPWVNQHEQTGLTVPPADPAALAAALRRLVDDPHLRAQFGEAGRARAHAEFRLDRMGERILGVYESVLQEGR